MTRAVSNAFTRSAVRATGEPARASFTPLRAEFVERSDGVRLLLSPMRALDVVPTMARETAGRFLNIIIEADGAGDIGDRHLPQGAAAICRHLNLPHEVVDEVGTVALTDAVLVRLLAQVEFRRLAFARVDGPVEPADARFLRRAARESGSTLSGDVRATQAATIIGDEFITYDVRDRPRAYQLVAENMRHYLAAVLHRSLGEVDAPAAWQIERLLGVSGSMIVRPIETEVYSTTVDVGIVTAPGSHAGPASHSLIYDLPSGSWHDEA